MVAARGGKDLMPELGYRPVNKYLLPRPGRNRPAPVAAAAPPEPPTPAGDNKLLRWVDRLLSR
jgi:hypothetical protein